MEVLGQVVVWLNAGANAVGGLLLAPLGRLSGWLSATLVAAVTGVLLLIIFKYTSSQAAIRRVRTNIQAHLLSLQLFQDSTGVLLRAQGSILLQAGWLMVLALVPMLVMTLPVLLLLGQLSLWYQARPLRVGEEAVVTLRLNGAGDSPPEVHLAPCDAVETTLGPVRILSQGAMCWNIKARQNGYHRLVFEVDGQAIAKDLAIGDGFMRVSAQRPAWGLWEPLEHPAEEPFRPDASVRSIEIDYPPRDSWTSGTDWWVLYWFAVSMVAALCFRPVLNVQV